MARNLLDIRVERLEGDSRAEHHVLPTASSASGLASYLPGCRRNTSSKKNSTASFRNPWPSFHKATGQEVRQSLEWGEDKDPAINLAASHLPTSSVKSGSESRPQQAAQLLQIDKPDFTFTSEDGHRAKSTWLGHAGVLLQLPALKKGSPPVRLIFDPMFSQRSSPSQYIGPIRSYDPPCKLEDLPPIDVLLISHNHFDHLDYETVMAIWRLNKDRMRFIVPLANVQWFMECGIPGERVTELDWWESAYLSEGGTEAGRLKVSCTPAQHSSVRDGSDDNVALWAGWYLQHELPDSRPYKIFFAGDSGYQCHADPSWPPKAPESTTHKDLANGKTSKVPDPDNVSPERYPPCPAYKEIATRLGTPDLVYLPIALGATWAYVRSFFSNYLPPSTVPVPRHSSGVSGAIHMPPWDAVRVLRALTSGAEKEDARPPLAIAIHWGTFVTEPVEILKTLGLLEWACYNQGVRFARNMDGTNDTGGGQPLFLALNHGQSIIT